MTDMEIWKPIPGFGGHYEASSTGRVRSKDRVVTRIHSSGKLVDFQYKGRILKGTQDDEGYIHLHIGVDKKKTSLCAHQAVLLAFVGPAPAGMEGCHSNGNSRDNTIGNLRWDTHFNNNQDRVKHGTYASGEDHHMAKMSAEMALAIYSSDESGVSLARRLGVCQTQVSSIRLGHIWATVTGGAPRPRPQGWSDDEIAVLRARYPNEPTAFIAAELKRNAGQVHQKASAIGLKKTSEYMSRVGSLRNTLRYGTQYELLAEARAKLGIAGQKSAGTDFAPITKT